MISVDGEFDALLGKIRHGLDYLLALSAKSEDAKLIQLALLAEGLMYIRFFALAEEGKAFDPHLIARTIQSAQAFCDSVAMEINEEQSV